MYICGIDFRAQCPEPTRTFFPEILFSTVVQPSAILEHVNCHRELRPIFLWSLGRVCRPQETKEVRRCN